MVGKLLKEWNLVENKEIISLSQKQLDDIISIVKKLPDEFCSINAPYIEQGEVLDKQTYSPENWQYLISKGVGVSVTRMGNAILHYTQKARVEDFRNKVLTKRNKTEDTMKKSVKDLLNEWKLNEDFKVGDRIEYIGKWFQIQHMPPVETGIKGTIIRDNGQMDDLRISDYTVKFDNGNEQFIKGKDLQKLNMNEGVAEIIRDQIGNRAFTMMGAKNLIKGKDDKGHEYLGWKIGRNAKSVGVIKVIYDEGPDTYILEFWTNRGNLDKRIEDVYVEDLHRFIEENTGMYLKL